MDNSERALHGREVLASLAAEYPQLYLDPGPEGAKLYREIVLSGADAPAPAQSAKGA